MVNDCFCYFFSARKKNYALTNSFVNCFSNRLVKMAHKQTKLLDEMRGFITFFRIFGLWPISRNSKFKVHLIVYSIFCICFVICIIIATIFMDKEFPNHTLSSIVEYVFLWSILFTHLIICLEALVNRNALMRLIEKIAYADFLFKSKLHWTICYRDERREIFVRFAVLIFSAVSARVTLLVHLLYENSIDGLWYECMCSLWILRLRFLQILFFVFLLRNRLSLVEEKIKELIQSQSFRSDKADNWPFSNDSRTVFVLDSLINKRYSYDRLLNLKQIYGELYDICELINMTFGCSILTIVLQNFIEFIGNSYWLFVVLRDSNINCEHVADIVVMLIYITVMLGTLVFYCSSCSRHVSFCFDEKTMKLKKINK